MPEFEGEDLALCVACGTQYDVLYDKHPARCRICDDPRQFIPPVGQQWTSLRRERGKHENGWKQDPHDERIFSLYADPKLGIGERAMLIKTEHGSVVWDLFAYLDDKLIDFINSQGRLAAIVISHPHFYTTHLDWAATFRCPIYVSALDTDWLNRPDPNNHRRLITDPVHEILPGVTAIRTGGHFPGSMVLHWAGHLFVADSIMTTPAALGPKPLPEGHSWYSFMWSIPNMIPLDPDGIAAIWEALRGFEFGATHGLMVGMDVYSEGCKGEVLRSMQLQVRKMGYAEHTLLLEEL